MKNPRQLVLPLVFTVLQNQPKISSELAKKKKKKEIPNTQILFFFFNQIAFPHMLTMPTLPALNSISHQRLPEPTKNWRKVAVSLVRGQSV